MPLLCRLSVAFLAILLSAPLNASFVAIPNLYNTGVEPPGVLLGNSGSVNAYTLVSKPASSTASLIAITSAGGFPIGPWIGDNSTSRWIRPNNPNDNDPSGNYVFRTTFDLTGFQSSTASITGRFATDNSGRILLNGTDIGAASSGFASWTNFSILSSSNLFVSGLNTLEFLVNNASGSSGNPVGLRVEMSGLVNAIPEPASALMFAMGIPAASLFLRRRRS